MGDGTHVMGLHIKGVHKENAQDALEDVETYLRTLWDQFAVLAAAPGPRTEDERIDVRREIETLRDEIEATVWKTYMCRAIVETPEDCIDDLLDGDVKRFLTRFKDEWVM